MIRLSSYGLVVVSLALGGCGGSGGGTGSSPGPVQYEDGNAGKDVDGALASRRAEVEAEEARTGRGEGPAFAKALKLEPKEPTVEDTLVATAQLEAPISPFTEVKYSWYVNDRRVSGVTTDRFPCQGRFQRGDKIYFVAKATDEEQRSVEVQSKSVRVGNSKPSITTDLRKVYGLHGFRLSAEDPDGDTLTWSVASGPPGISVSASGMVRLKQVNIDEAFEGEVVFAAEDPMGARAELHIPVNVNAAREAKVDVEERKTVRHRRDVTDAEFEKASLEAGEAIEKMSPEEFEKYVQKQMERAR